MKKADIIIVGTGAAGLYAALHAPKDKNILMITKAKVEESDSFLAQGGICMLKNEDDYDSYFEDTMRAGHYENNPRSVETMIRTSPNVIKQLISFGVEFEHDNGKLAFTREGAHSTPRILFHKDITGKEITSKLLENVRRLSNVIILEETRMLDIITRQNRCYGVVVKKTDDSIEAIGGDYVFLACGGLGGLYENSTNFPHLTGDALAIALAHNVKLQNINYIQIHPTTLYSKKKGRRFLISESVRGEGAVLLNSKKERFVDELLPRDVVTKEIWKEMKKEGTKHVWLDMSSIGEEEIHSHFPNIYQHCLEEGYDVTKECIPVTPAQHYFMGGIWVDQNSKTSMEHLYAIGETSCNGVHGANRLASNSLLESLVFGERAMKDMCDHYEGNAVYVFDANLVQYQNEEKLEQCYKERVLDAIEKENTKCKIKEITNERLRNNQIKCR